MDKFNIDNEIKLMRQRAGDDETKTLKEFLQLMTKTRNVVNSFLTPIHEALFTEVSRHQYFQYTPTSILDCILGVKELKMEFKNCLNRVV